MIRSREVRTLLVFSVFVELLWSEIAFSLQQECFELFFKAPQETVVNIDSLVYNTSNIHSSFDKFKKFSDLTGHDVYVARTAPDESTSSSNIFVNHVYTPAKSVIGLESLVGGSYNLDNSSILNKIGEFRHTLDGKTYTDSFYDALITIKSYDPQFYLDLMDSLKEFVEWDPLELKKDNWLKRDANRVQGLNDPELENVNYMLAAEPTVAKRISEISRKILAIESREDYPVKQDHTFFQMNQALFLVLTYLYYTYYADVYVSSDCSGVVLSHNVLLTSGKCVYNAAYLTYYHNGRKVNSIKHEVNPRYLYDSDSYSMRDTLTDFPSRSNMGIVVFPDYTFGDVPPATISFREIKTGEELISVGYKLTEGFVKLALLKKGAVKSEIFTVIDPKPKLARVGYGEIGGALFNDDGNLVGSISSLLWFEPDEKPYSLYAVTFSDSNRDFLFDVVRRYPQINVEE